jgi:protein O-GlcNAc transferase
MRGIDPNRLIFAEMIAFEDHLERLKLADLALDTRIYNGGATTSNALWAGIPLITLQGNHFVSRMSASSLAAIGLPELIVPNLKEYTALAVRLAKNPAELNSIKLKLEKNRLTAPMFDTPRFANSLEKAYRQMWQIFQSSENPRPINVLDSEGF